MTSSRRGPDVSVVICCYTEQRWDDLVAAVESVVQQTVAPRETIVVVDYNDRLFERAARELPARVVPNAEAKGLSGARNTGIAASTGALIAFLDDDGVAEPDWLFYLTEWHAESQVMGAGGLLRPRWVEPRPRWFPEEFDWVVGCSYRGMPEHASPVRNPLGGSMCIRREVFAAVGSFRSGIGREGTRPFGCEETELSIRARQRWPGRIFLYEPRAIVHHTVPAGRGRWDYFRARCYAEGQSKAFVSRFVGARDGLAAERSYTTRTLPRGVVRGVADLVGVGDPWGAARAGAIMAGLAWTGAGYLVGRWSRRTANPPEVTALRTGETRGAALVQG
jgi:glycosyltransferase involved in cell wall biosynthesis